MKETTYNRLKRENKELQNEIINLNNKLSIIAENINYKEQQVEIIEILLPIKLQNKLVKSVENLIWSGVSVQSIDIIKKEL